MSSLAAARQPTSHSEYKPQALVCDIGHTHLRFALSDLDELTIANYALLRTELFASPLDALQAYLRTTPERPEHICFAVSGEVNGASSHFADKDWSLDIGAVRKLTGASNIRVVNRFEALALALPHLASEDLTRIGGGEPVASAPMALVVPGTGLNVAVLVRTPGGDVPASGHGGLVGFAPNSIAEFEMVRELAGDIDFVPAEALISTPGIVAVYQLLRKQNGRTVGPATAPEIVAAAGFGDVDAQRAIALFSNWLGRFAADVALTLGARGGVFIGGSVTTNIKPMLATGTFREAFEKKGRMSRYLAAIPLFLIGTPNAGLKGAAIAARQGVEGAPRGR